MNLDQLRQYFDAEDRSFLSLTPSQAKKIVQILKVTLFSSSPLRISGSRSRKARNPRSISSPSRSFKLSVTKKISPPYTLSLFRKATNLLFKSHLPNALSVLFQKYSRRFLLSHTERKSMISLLDLIATLNDRTRTKNYKNEICEAMLPSLLPFIFSTHEEVLRLHGIECIHRILPSNKNYAFSVIRTSTLVFFLSLLHSHHFFFLKR